MKKFIRLFLMVLVLALANSSFSISESSPADALDLKAMHEERVFACLTTLTRYLTDDLDIFGTQKEFVQNSDAWNKMLRYDRGWFSKHISKTIKNQSTDHWTRISDTEFCAEAYCDFEVQYIAGRESVIYPCAYHFCFIKTDAAKDPWMVKDFHVIQNPDDQSFADRFTSENEGVSLSPVSGNTFTGFMMTIDDPSRVFVGTIPRFDNASDGMQIDKLIKLHDAIGGINGGGFDEGPGGSGRPSGVVVTNGVFRKSHHPYNQLTGVLIGFDQDNKLHVGNFYNNETAQLNLRDALGFGPALIIDGIPQETGETRNDYSSRTAIGQDAQGRVLMLVARGRQPDSMGADMKDLTKIMLDFGAVNAGNLDGGSSTAMYYNNEIVFSGFRLEPSRAIPTAFLIRKLPE